MQKFLMALTTAAVLAAGSSTANAALIFGSEKFQIAQITPPGTGAGELLSGISSFTKLEFKTDGGFIDFAPYALNESLGLTSLDSLNLANFSFGSAAFGFFNADSGQDFVMGTSRSFEFLGTFSPGFGGYDPTYSRLTISFTQAGGAQTAISASATLASLERPGQISHTPEPTSLALFGTMCIPLALGAFRRRQKAAQAAL